MAYDPLLQPILNDPNDDEARLAYADAMDRQGGPRGQFIRIQIALARIEYNSNHPAWFDLTRESQRLTREFGARWAGEVAGIATAYEFERGFVGQVTMPARDFVEKAPQLFEAAPIQHLDITVARGAVQDLWDSPYLVRIRSLDLKSCRLVDPDIERMAASPNVRELRWLSLVLNHLGIRGAEALAQSKNVPNLQYVAFAGNNVDPGQQFEWDQGIVSDSWLPPEGQQLEARYGPLPWLHCQPENADEFPPNRYVLAHRATA